jgi:hypothetical protein
LTLDKFGIKQLYTSKPGTTARSWWSKWDNGVPRKWGSKGTDKRNADPQDPECDLHCKQAERGIVTIADVDGSDICTLSGTTPRLYINDPQRIKKWFNVEMTCYFRVVKKFSGGGAYVGLRLAGRSNHQNEYNCTASGTGYSFEAKASNGYNQLKKELVHPAYADNIVSNVKGVKTGVWYGHKLIVGKQTDGSVKVQGWRDTTEGKNGGDWKLLVEKVDKGDWKMTDSVDLAAFNKAKDCPDLGFKKYPSPTSILSESAYSCYFRCDNVQVELKYASIREIGKA